MIRKYAEIFCWKNVSSLCKSYSHFFSKRISEYCVVNPLKQLTKWLLTRLTWNYNTQPVAEFKKKQTLNILKILLCTCSKIKKKKKKKTYFRLREQMYHMTQGRVWSFPVITICINLVLFFTFVLVLGGNLWWTRNWPHRNLPWWLWPSARENQRLLQWSHRFEFFFFLDPLNPNTVKPVT